MVHCTVFQWSVVLYSFLMYVCQYNTVVLLQVGGQLNFLHLFAFRLRTQAAAVDQITFLHTICYYECSHICGLFSFLCLTSVLNISFHATGCNCTATNDLTALLWAVSIEVCSNVKAFIMSRYMQTLNFSITVVSLQLSIVGAPFEWICELEHVVLPQLGATRSMVAHVMHTL